MIKIRINPRSQTKNAHEAIIGEDAIKFLPTYLKQKKIGNKYAIITDTKIEKIYGLSLKRYLQKNDIQCELISFKEGEASKSLKTVEELAEKLLAKGFDRKDAILALGGGVTGDLAGFLASIYMRGIPYIHLPTSLLAMVDSCIGGKTGVDLESGKNLLGTITQPAAIFMDTNYLKGLPKTQIINGLAEVIKYGVICDAKLFNFIEQNLEAIINLEKEPLIKIIKRSVEIKASIIQKDVREAGPRMLLNYGHTYGHALETLSNYRLPHGFAISIGMVIINNMAVKKGLLKKIDADRIKKLLKTAGLPITSMLKPTIKDLLKDKKKEGHHINFVIATKIGKATIYKEDVSKY